jgi:4-hydroxybenzoyl-CoA thioesterase
MKEVVHTVKVEFGDCDPAGIVWFPNFFRWIDHASRTFFSACGVPPWYELEARTGVLGTPLVDTKCRFVNSVTYGETLQIHVHIAEWRGKSFVQKYRILRGEGDSATLILECEEVRIFAARTTDGQGGNGIRAVPIPEDIRRLCA